MNLKAATRRPINNAFAKSRVLAGLEKVTSPAKGLLAVSDALAEAGYTLDMVTGDMLLGERGVRLLPFRCARIGDDPFTEGEPVTNSRVSFAWENVSGDQFNPRVEIIAYLS